MRAGFQAQNRRANVSFGNVRRHNFVAELVGFVAVHVFILLNRVTRFGAYLIVLIPGVNQTGGHAGEFRVEIYTYFMTVGVIARKMGGHIDRGGVVTSVNFTLQNRAGYYSTNIVAVVAAVGNNG